MSARTKLFLLLLLAVGSCKGNDTGGTGPTSFDLTGTFEGVIVLRANPFTGFVDSIPLTLVLSHSGASFTGTWEADTASGIITGTVDESAVIFALTQIVPCDGSFSGTAAITFDGARLRGTLAGSDCAGTTDATFVVDRTSAPPASPLLELTPASITFSATVGGGDPALATVGISNGGGGTLTGLSAGTVSYGPGASGWLGTPVLTGTTAPTTIGIAPTVGSLGAGTYTATVPVASTSATNSPQTIAVTLVVSAAPVGPNIGLSSDSVSFTAMAGGGDPAASTVNITNAGGGSLTGIAIGVVTYGPGATGWLSTVSLGAGSAPTTLTLQPTVGALTAGSYEATVEVTSPVAGNSPAVVTVTFTVTSVPTPPSIVLSSTTVDFTGTAGGTDPPASTLNISNGGGGTLDGLAVGTISYGPGASGWLAATLGATAAPTTLAFQPTTGSLAAGTYTATVPVTSGAAANSPQTVSVTFTIAAPPPAPSIVLSPTSLGFTASAGGGDPAAQTSNVTNGGGGTLSGLAVGTISYGPGASGWLTATLSATIAPSTLTLEPATGSLAAGTHTATVPVASGVATNSPQTVTVTFTVSALPPAIVLGATSASFGAIEAGNDPAALVVTVTNGGGGTLSGLAVGSITYSAGGSGWLGATLGSTGAPTTLTLTPATGILAAGTYTATVPVSSGVASNSPVNLAVTFTVDPPWIKGWNFRATPGFVSDGANETWFTRFDSYSVNRNGVTFGTLGGPLESRDRNNTLDPRLAGQMQVTNASPTQGRLRIDLAAPGDYRVRLAVGDAGSSQAYQYLEIRDGIGGAVLLVIDEPTGTLAGQWIDAGGVKRDAANWIASNQGLVISPTGAVLEIVLGESGTSQLSSSTVAHVSLQKLSP